MTVNELLQKLVDLAMEEKGQYVMQLRLEDEYAVTYLDRLRTVEVRDSDKEVILDT